MTTNISPEALLPCPFCGHADFDQWPNESVDATGANVVRCVWCNATAPMKAWSALASRQPVWQPVTHRVLQVGSKGSAYDPPNTYRAFTYADQPNNALSWLLGEAARNAAPGGDLIDHGLSLLDQLQQRGFGVFQIGEPAAQVDLGQFREAVECWRRTMFIPGQPIAENVKPKIRKADELLALISRMENSHG